MNFRISIYLVLVLSIYSCSSEIESVERISINLKELDPKGHVLSNEALRFVPIDLPDSIYFGEINHIKSYGELRFLHDQFQTKTLTVVDENGAFKGQLKKIGEGPGEYTSLDAFTFNPKNGFLTIYDRSKFRITTYQYPDLELIRSVRTEKYLMNIEFLGENKIMAFSENVVDERSYEGVILINEDGKVTQSLDLATDPSSMEISYPNTVASRSGEVYYAEPSSLTRIYRMGTLPEPIFEIDFEVNRIPERFWSSIDASEFEQSLLEGDKATWVQNLIFSDSSLFFSFLFRDIDTRYFASFDYISKDLTVYKNLLINNTSIQLPNPIGVTETTFLSILFTENVKEKDIEGNSDFVNAYNISQSRQGYLLIESRIDKK